MRKESKRARAERIKKKKETQRRSTLLSMGIAILTVLILAVALLVGKASLAAKNKEYEKQVEQLQAQIDEENKRTEELKEYEKYVQTKKFAEEVAKRKFGLIYPDEIIFKDTSK